MEYRDKLLFSDLPLEIPREDMQLVTICNYGQVRSVCMAQNLKDLGFKKTYATGFMRWHPSIVNMQLQDADLVIVCNKPNLEELMTDTELFMKKDNIPKKFAHMLKEVVNHHESKMVVCNGIGYDRWGDPMKPGLQRIVQDFLSEIPKNE